MYQVKDSCGALHPITEDNVVCHCSKCGKEIQVNPIEEMASLHKHNAPLAGSVIICKDCIENRSSEQIQSYRDCITKFTNEINDLNAIRHVYDVAQRLWLGEGSL